MYLNNFGAGLNPEQELWAQLIGRSRTRPASGFGAGGLRSLSEKPIASSAHGRSHADRPTQLAQQQES